MALDLQKNIPANATPYVYYGDMMLKAISGFSWDNPYKYAIGLNAGVTFEGWDSPITVSFETLMNYEVANRISAEIKSQNLNMSQGKLKPKPFQVIIDGNSLFNAKIAPTGATAHISSFQFTNLETGREVRGSISFSVWVDINRRGEFEVTQE